MALHHRLDGPADAPAVVLTHGGLLDHRSWDAQVAALRKDHRVLVWDIPGHGDSPPLETYSNAGAADALVSLLDRLGIARASFVGFSVGGYIAQEVAYRHPDRVTALACLGTTPLTLSKIPRPAEWLFHRSAMLMRPVPFSWIRWLMSRVLARKPDVRAYIREASARVRKQAFLSFWRGVSHSLRYEPDYTYDHPLLIARGAHDLVGPVRFLEKRWKAHCPHAEVAHIPDAGHCANQDNPDFTNALLRRFLSQVSDER